MWHRLALHIGGFVCLKGSRVRARAGAWRGPKPAKLSRAGADIVSVATAMVGKGLAAVVWTCKRRFRRVPYSQGSCVQGWPDALSACWSF